jgi:hypothetical protein
MTRPNEESRGEIILYQTADGTVELDVRLERETIWLNQKQMALLFDKDTDTIGLHIRNAYKEGELEESATTEESSVVQKEGGRSVRRPVRFYNLDVVISVGYRVKSKRGTQFRIWATKLLRDHLLKGYTINERRLHGSSLFGWQKDEGLQGALGAVMQTFGGRDLYPSLEEKAAHLLYFLIKNNAFVDGNKRIGSASRFIPHR